MIYVQALETTGDSSRLPETGTQLANNVDGRATVKNTVPLCLIIGHMFPATAWEQEDDFNCMHMGGGGGGGGIPLYYYIL